MKILVLGSAGQIGAPACKYLREQGHEVIEYDIKDDINYDLRYDNLLRTLSSAIKKCDFVYYLASDVGGAKYLEKNEHSYKFIENNMLMMCNVFHHLDYYKKPFIFTSSQMADLHHSTYGMLKLLGEKMTNDIGGLVVRLWNVYGPEHDEEKSHVITDFCKMAKYQGVINMRTNGDESRQLLYVEDCAEALLTLTDQYDTLDKTKPYHITSFKWTSIKEVAGIIHNIHGGRMGMKWSSMTDQTQMNAMNPPDPYILNFWEPKTSLEEGIRKIYESC
jgi:nucleoside-diphosphate-sugar epimerase